MSLTRTLLLGISIVLITSACSNTSGEDQKKPTIPETTTPDVEEKELSQDEQTEQLPIDSSEPPIDIETIVQTPDLVPDPIILPDPIITTPDSVTVVILPTPDPVYAQVHKGVFLDSEVAGLVYSTNSTIGVTDADGSFEFYLNDTIEFSLGDIILGSVNSEKLFFYDPESSYPFSLGTSKPNDQYNTAVITPLTITPDAEFEDDHRVINKLIFLQTLDINGNPDDGIEIPEIISSKIHGWDIDFNLSVDEFSAGGFARLVNYLNELEVFTDNSPRQITNKIDALIHFKKIRPAFPSIGLILGPDRYHIYWSLSEECSSSIHSILEMDGDNITFKPISSESITYNGVRIGNGTILFPTFEVEASCPEICAQPTIETNLVRNLDEVSGTIKAYCDKADSTSEYTLTPRINKHVYSIDFGSDSGFSISN